MVLLDVVYLSMNRNRSYASVTPRHMEDISREIELHIRCCNPVIIGLQSSRMRRNLLKDVIDAKEWGIFPVNKNCL